MKLLDLPFKEQKKLVPMRGKKVFTGNNKADKHFSNPLEDIHAQTCVPNEPFETELKLHSIEGDGNGGIFGRFTDSNNIERIAFNGDLLEILKSEFYVSGKIKATFSYRKDSPYDFYSIKINHE